MGEGSQLLMLSFLFAPLSPLVGERGWGIEGEGKKPTLVRGGTGGLHHSICVSPDLNQGSHLQHGLIYGCGQNQLVICRKFLRVRASPCQSQPTTYDHTPYLLPSVEAIAPLNCLG